MILESFEFLTEKDYECIVCLTVTSAKERTKHGRGNGSALVTASLYKMFREGLSEKVTFEQRSLEQICGKNISGKENIKGKILLAGECLAFWR